jgi:hypothetical protein
MDYRFDKAIKLYIEDDQVLCSLRVNDLLTITKTFTVKEFQYIVDHWVLGVSGYDTEHLGKIWWEYRSHGPRPECKPMEFVAISIQGFNWRISIQDMQSTVEQFETQLSNN